MREVLMQFDAIPNCSVVVVWYSAGLAYYTY